MDASLSSYPDASSGSASIGILIATYNRMDALLICLRHLEAQTCRDFEVTVVIDGSTDETTEMLQQYLLQAKIPLRVVSQPNGGVARARNAGARLISQPLCLLLGDDIFAAPDLVARHLAFHQEHQEESAVALGLTRWANVGQVVTPFMRWLEDDGVQFAYGELMRGAQPTWKHFYTSNLSMKTRYLEANPFSEDFPGAGMEDIELGYRLAQKKGLTMYFLRDAVGQHLHPTDFAQSCRRVRHNGAMAAKFAEVWPEHRWHAPKSVVKRLVLRMAEPMVVLPVLTWVAGMMTRIWCPNPLLKAVLTMHFRSGYARAEHEAAGRGIRDLQSEEACSVPGERTISGADKRD